MSVYYNEWDSAAAQWLRNLIKAGHLPPGDVDERSIKDVRADDLVGYTQLHFFAGIGGWPLAARLAGWPDDREIVTGSCPCQPYSVAGKGEGDADPRNLWPDFFRILSARRPACIMGEQVQAAVGKGWLDRVRTDLEGIGYAVRGVGVPACAVNAPHRRDRLWFVAGSMGDAQGERRDGRQDPAEQNGWLGTETAGGDVADRNDSEWRADVAARNDADGHQAGWKQVASDIAERGASAVADGDRNRCSSRDAATAPTGYGGSAQSIGGANAWDSSAWIIGHDGKARRVGTRVRRMDHGLSAGMAGMRTGTNEEIEMIPLLAHSVRGRVAKLKGLGNAIVPAVAAEVIKAWMECYP